MADEIIEELWTIKDAIAKEHGYDIKAFAAYLRAKDRGGDEQVVDLRSIERTGERPDQSDSNDDGRAK